MPKVGVVKLRQRHTAISKAVRTLMYGIPTHSMVHPALHRSLQAQSPVFKALEKRWFHVRRLTPTKSVPFSAPQVRRSPSVYPFKESETGLICVRLSRGLWLFKKK